jgi:hypothetical protein
VWEGPIKKINKGQGGSVSKWKEEMKWELRSYSSICKAAWHYHKCLLMIAITEVKGE